MKLKKSVYSKIFIGSSAFITANIFMFILWLFGLKAMEVNFYISGFSGLITSFILNNKINTIPYDEYDNDNVKFFIILILSLILLIVQAVFLAGLRD
ncbi:MAG: hypothetical protein ACFNLN_07065 [Treponema socranskii subsp. buccale]